MKKMFSLLISLVLISSVFSNWGFINLNAFQKPGDNPGGQGSQYTLEQAMSDNAQLSTIAFNGLAFITGNSGADTFFPPGKVADFFGFQYMRDVDTAGYGHNTTFLSRVANNVLYILNDAQKAKLITLAKEQAPIYTNFAYNRFPLMNAFRKSLEGKEPTGSTGLNQQLVGKYTANLYLYDAELSYNRALVVGGIISSFTDEQKAYLAKMEFNNYKSWPDVKEDETLKKSMNNNEFVAVMTYASELFSWYKGGVDPDVYFCPERHGTYFGGFFMKDYPAMNDPNYFISTDITGESGKAFLAILDAQQRPLVEGIINEQRANLTEIAKIRTTVVTEMRKVMSGGTMDKEKVFSLIKRYGELDGLLSGLYASRFAAVNKTLTQTQRTALIKLRNLDVVPEGAYRFSSPVAMPELPNNDYLFGVGTFPADAGQTKAPTSFGETKDDNRPPAPGDKPPGGPKNFVDSTFDGTIVLGSPTNTQVTANITANQTFFVRLEWGEKTNEYNQKSSNTEVSNLKPAVIIMNNLQPNKTYYYRLFFKSATDKEPKTTKEYTFQTPRSLGASYSFVVQSDSHLLNKADKEIYTKSMQTMASYKPDFMFDLGDTFLNDQVAKPQYQSYETIRQTSFQQRSYLDNVTRSAYLFLTIGNHEGEYGYFLDGTDKNLTVMSTLARKTFYPNPEPNEFYSGNSTKEDFVGLPQNYYAFQWGDALYISIDYYRYMKTEPSDFKDGWTWTLGKTQYDWFRKTLEESTAKYKFVFAHHEGGLSRGGEVLVKFFEWGGYDKNGKYLFDQKRPGWGKPIHQVMKDTGVTIFFQGHDHLFAREVVDSVVYQTLPKPAEKIPDQQNNFGTYPKADLLLNSGFVKVDVAPANVTVSYFRNYFVSSEPQEGNTGIVYSYTVDSAHNVKVTLPKKDDVSKYGGSTDSGSGKDKEKKESKKDITIEIDGKEIKSDPSPILDSNGRIQVPLRLIAENLGCSVLWQENGKKNAITIKKTGVVIELMVGSKNASVNGQTKSMDSAPFVQNGRTFVPLRFVGEAIGVTIEWDSINKIVKITTKPTPPTEDVTTDSVNNIILGCPTDNSILGKAIADFDMDSYLVYGKQPGLLSEKSTVISSKAGEMIEYNLTNLAPDTQYYYQRMYRKTGTIEYKIQQSGQFHTQRKGGSKFVFTIQADPHRDENSDLPLYETALKNILTDLGDFHIDLGDTFMGEKLGRTKEGTLKRYLEDRAYFAKISSAIPLFLVNGNHDGECGWNQQKNSDNIAIWASTNRLKLFPSPTPGSFYSGTTPGAGNYYSYTWGDALFITLDPFWFTEKKAQGNEDGWNYTLGKTQYDWLKNTLETSHAKFKFVFIHNLVGGYGKDSRGGAEAAKFFEWGGSNFDGSYGFDQKRSGWGKPIHQLLVDNHVSAVFHGHDHFYAKQELDGIIYQLVPQPSHPGSDVRNASEYSYLKGLFLPPAGHLRVSVSSTEVKVEYVKASLGQNNGIIADSYTIPLSKSLLNTNNQTKRYYPASSFSVPNKNPI